MGGDGTLHEIINGLLNRKDGKILPIGIIPTGSGNSFSEDIGISSIEHSIKKIINRKIEYCDIMKIEMKNQILYSCNIIGWGLVNKIGNQAEKYRWLGNLRYTIFSIIEVVKYKSKFATLIFDSKNISNDYKFIMISNTIHAGNKMKISPKAKINDGLLDVISIPGNVSKLKLLKLLPKVYHGTHINDTIIDYHQTPKIKLQTKSIDSLNVDGEKIGETPITVSILSKKIKIFY